jgi:DNA-binding CsgD family transcriptional regulator
MTENADDESGAELLSRLVGLVYDCALDPSRWEPTLTEIRQALGFCNGMFTVWTAPAGQVLLNITSGIADDYAARLSGHGADIVAQWGGAERIAGFAVGEPKVLSWERRRSEWADCLYYREWIEPQGIIDLMAIAVTRDSNTTCSVGFARHGRDGAIGVREVRLARLLAPHIQRAVAISRLLDLKSLAAASFAATLDAVSAAIVLVGDDLGIVAANRAARTMMANRDCLVDARGTLSLATRAETVALKFAARRARPQQGETAQAATGVAARRADASPAVLHVVPLRYGDLRPGLAPGATMAIIAAPATGTMTVSREAVAALFGLTPTEARVFASIAEGRTLGETAQRLGIGAATAKTHLLRLFGKTGTRRQAELVRLAASLAMPA